MQISLGQDTLPCLTIQSTDVPKVCMLLVHSKTLSTDCRPEPRANPTRSHAQAGLMTSHHIRLTLTDPPPPRLPPPPSQLPPPPPPPPRACFQPGTLICVHLFHQADGSAPVVIPHDHPPNRHTHTSQNQWTMTASSFIHISCVMTKTSFCFHVYQISVILIDTLIQRQFPARGPPLPHSECNHAWRFKNRDPSVRVNFT